MGLGTMSRGEKAAIFVSKAYMTKSPLIPFIEDHEEIQFEIELVHFIQVPIVLFTLEELFEHRNHFIV